MPPRQSSGDRPNHWPLQNAKARFSELVRRAKSDGPQHVTVHGRDEVVVISVEAFRRLSGKAGHTFTQPDLIIAATGLHHGLTIVTRDTGDYSLTRAAVFNPWTGS